MGGVNNRVPTGISEPGNSPVGATVTWVLVINQGQRVDALNFERMVVEVSRLNRGSS